MQCTEVSHFIWESGRGFTFSFVHARFLVLKCLAPEPIHDNEAWVEIYRRHPPSSMTADWIEWSHSIWKGQAGSLVWEERLVCAPEKQGTAKSLRGTPSETSGRKMWEKAGEGGQPANESRSINIRKRLQGLGVKPLSLTFLSRGSRKGLS